MMGSLRAAGLCFLWLVFVAAAAWGGEPQAGDLVVTVELAAVKSKDATLGQVASGATLPVVAVKGNWIKIVTRQDGERIAGWVRRDQVKKVEFAPDEVRRLRLNNAALRTQVEELERAVAELRGGAVERSGPQNEGRPPGEEGRRGQHLGKWDGFRGIEWGTNIRHLEGMKLVDTGGALLDKGIEPIRLEDEDDDDREQRYTRRGDKMAIGEAELSNVWYSFYKGRFASVAVVPKTPADFWRLEEVVGARYGEETRWMPRVQLPGIWFWKGPIGTGGPKVSVTLGSPDSAPPMGMLLLQYLPIEQEQARDNKRAIEGAAEKAARDF